MNTDRKKIPVRRDIEIEEVNNLVSKKELLNAVSKMEDGESAIMLQRRQGFGETWGGDQNSEGTYYNYPVLVVESYRPETNEEYLKRMRQEEADMKKKEDEERRTYLRLKAKFEYEAESPTDQQIENMNTQ